MNQMVDAWNMPPCTGVQGPYKTKEERKNLHGLIFDFGEAMRSHEPDRKKLQAIETEINEQRIKILTAKVK